MAPNDASTKVWLDYTQEELDWQYDHSKRFSDIAAFGAENRRDSGRVRETLEGRLDIPYGPGEDELLDVFPAGDGAPVAVFLHGGSWRAGHKDNCAFPAESFVPRGVAWVAVNFTTIPRCDLDEMVRQCREAVAWVARHAESFGGDPGRIHVLGHSSGSHLTAMMLVTDWQATHGLPQDPIKGAVCISGMYDLEPVMLSYRSSFLALDEAGIARNSPIRHIRKSPARLLAGCGELETPEFHRQPHEFVEAWGRAGNDGAFLVLPGKHHFSARAAYNEPDGELLEAVFRQIGA